MGNSDNVREALSWKELLFDAHVQRYEIAAFAKIVVGAEGVNVAFDIATKGFARLVEAIAEGDRAKADEVLCGWGIRR